MSGDDTSETTIVVVCSDAMSAEGLEQQTRNYLSNNVLQIQEHCGHFEVREVDDVAGTATIAIGRKMSTSSFTKHPVTADGFTAGMVGSITVE